MSQVLSTKSVEKPWGQDTLPPPFSAPHGKRIGEIWFEPPPELPELLVKYLFTSENLSVQVHPSDAQAPAGSRGKEECWLVLTAEPGAKLAIGFTEPVSPEKMRAAALDGSIEQLLAWHEVGPGDFVYLPANTVHAIGAGLSLIEVQQNSDITYRLYDYGRPRELHLEDGVAVSDAIPWVAPSMPGVVADGRSILVEGPKFVLERWDGGTRDVALPRGVQGWVVPVLGGGRVDGLVFTAGECVTVEGGAVIEVDAGGDVLFAYPLGQRIDLSQA